MKPRKNDLVVSPYAGRKLVDGGTAPEHGVVRSVSRGYAYVDFSVGSLLQAIPVSDLRPADKTGGDTDAYLPRVRVWKEAR